MSSEQNSLKKILIVDDDPDVLESLIQVLEFEGYQVKGARSGSEAIQIFSNEIFDLVISDLLMPHMNGKELYSHLAQNANRPFCFLLSTATHPNDLPEPTGFAERFSVIKKPFEIDTFSQAVQNLLEG